MSDYNVHFVLVDKLFNASYRSLSISLAVNKNIFDGPAAKDPAFVVNILHNNIKCLLSELAPLGRVPCGRLDESYFYRIASLFLFFGAAHTAFFGFSATHRNHHGK